MFIATKPHLKFQLRRSQMYARATIALLTEPERVVGIADSINISSLRDLGDCELTALN